MDFMLKISTGFESMDSLRLIFLLIVWHSVTCYFKMFTHCIPMVCHYAGFFSQNKCSKVTVCSRFKMPRSCYWTHLGDVFMFLLGKKLIKILCPCCSEDAGTPKPYQKVCQVLTTEQREGLISRSQVQDGHRVCILCIWKKGGIAYEISNAFQYVNQQLYNGVRKDEIFKHSSLSNRMYIFIYIYI